MPARPALRVEALEPRDCPAAFGTPWPDGSHITLSTAPDGTAVSGTASNLSATLAALGPNARLELLRAFQTWAVQAGVNFGLVADNGAAFGTGGAVQGDPRFGDVRIGGRRLPADVLAVTAPYDWSSSYSGDVVVNTAGGFGPGGRDLFTVLLQEAGHTLGIGNSPDPASAQYEYYLGARTGLSAGDIAAVRALYGARPADEFDATGPNGTVGTADRYTGPLTADLTTAADVDVYKFTTGLLTSGLTVNLKAAGLSLLTAKVEVLDGQGNVVASAFVTDPTRNDVTVSVGRAKALTNYFVRVSSARTDVFGVGRYDLDVSQSTVLTPVTGLVGGLLDETGLNDTLVTATSLLTKTLSVGPQAEYSTTAAFGSANDVDYFRIKVPTSGVVGPAAVIVTVWGEDGAALAPGVRVQDAFGRAVPVEVLTADGGATIVQARGLSPGGTYYLRLASDTRATGRYHLTADIRPTPVEVAAGGRGTLSAAQPVAAAGFTLAQSGQVHFVVEAGSGNRAAVLVVTNAAGQEVGRLTAAAGKGRSVDLFLAAGTYRVAVHLGDGTGALSYTLRLAVVTDPVGARPADAAVKPVEANDSAAVYAAPADDGDVKPVSAQGDGAGYWWNPEQDAGDAMWY